MQLAGRLKTLVAARRLMELAGRLQTFNGIALCSNAQTLLVGCFACMLSTQEWRGSDLIPSKQVIPQRSEGRLSNRKS